MKLYNLKVSEYLEEASSKKPVPGGGSVAALVAALGASMIEMVANFSSGKNRFPHIQSEIKKILISTREKRKSLTLLIDEDAKAYREVAKAFKSKKGTQQAIKKAIKVPLKIAEICLFLIKFCPFLIDKANPNLRSDAFIAEELLYAGFDCAQHNIEINQKYLQDKDFYKKLNNKLKQLKRQIMAIHRRVKRRKL